MDLKELKQLQSALKNTQGVTLARKLPKQLGLTVDFKGHQFRVEYLLNLGWRVTRGYGELPNSTELAHLIPVILRAEQEKEAEAIAKAEAAKAKAEEERKAAIAQTEAEKKKTEELRDYCRLTVVPGFDRQSWCENHFGYGKWHIAELNRQELEILADEIKCRADKEGRAKAEEKARERYGHDCSNYALDENGEILCHGSGPIEFGPEDEEVEEEEIAQDLCMDEEEEAINTPTPGEEVEGQFYQFGSDGQIHEGRDLETFLSETSLQDFFPGCVVEVEKEAIAPAPPQWILDNAQALLLYDYGTREIPNGKPYRPSNGSEGDWFMGGWCEQCSRLNSCSIPVMSMAGEQPPEWVYWDRKPICLAWDEAIADKPLAYYPYQGFYKVGDAEGNLEEFESAEEAIEFINNWGKVPLPAEAKTGKSLALYQIAEEVTQ